jgi:tetratricopeptide (TPR) repeat protein
VLNNLGNVHRRQGRFADAARYYELALEMNERFGDSPNDRVPTRINLAVCWLALGRPEPAASQAREVLALQPQNASALKILRRAESAAASPASR